MNKFVIHKRFNSASGEIVRKYAWDSALAEMRADGTLDKILDHLEEKE
jgi:hypothetical protein